MTSVDAYSHSYVDYNCKIYIEFSLKMSCDDISLNLSLVTCNVRIDDAISSVLIIIKICTNLSEQTGVIF